MMYRLPDILKTLAMTMALLTLTVPAKAQAELDQRAADDPVSVSAELKLNDRSSAVLTIHAKIDDGFHIYAQSQPKPFLATRIEIVPSNQFDIMGPFKPSVEPQRLRHEALDVKLHEFEREVSWNAPVKLLCEIGHPVPTLTGHVFAQACTADRCLAPRKYSFTATVTHSESVAIVTETVGSATNNARPAGGESEGSELAASPRQTGFSLESIEIQGDSEATESLILILPLALLAGFLLNFMPCVLPVVGLKVLSFVKQASDSRGKMFLLNLSYSAGLISVMLILASLAAFAGLGWGEQFSSAGFNITLAVVVFAFGLSFLGVWEIPVPGLVGKAAGSHSAQREGYLGAFIVGALSTILATPCSGPFLGSALTWAVLQPVYLTYLVFGAVGLGMASPYLLIGLFPKLGSFLPKPGNWMVTFKQVMGFVLLATVVYLMSFMPIPSVVPTALLLLGIGVACWRLGTVVIMGTRSQKVRAWGEAALITLVVTFVSFGWLEGLMANRFERAAQRITGSLTATHDAAKGGRQDGIPWEPFSRDRLEELVRQGKTVFVDFTADWCLTCKSNEAVAIETAEVRELLQRNGIVALRADKTKPAPEVDETLRLLGNRAASIPFYAVFPAGRPQKPITLDGVFTSPKPVVDALTTAGPSHRKQTVASAASGNTRESLSSNDS